jgi:RHS repeat-associated protein
MGLTADCREPEGRCAPFGRVVRPEGSAVDYCEHPGMAADVVNDALVNSVWAQGCYGAPAALLFGRESLGVYEDPAAWDGFVTDIGVVPATTDWWEGTCRPSGLAREQCVQAVMTRNNGAQVRSSALIGSSVRYGATAEELRYNLSLFRGGCTYHAKAPGWWTGEGYTPPPPRVEEIEALLQCTGLSRRPGCIDGARPLREGPSGDDEPRDCAGDPIDLATGELHDRVACFSVTGIGPEPLDAGLEYRSGMAERGESSAGLPPGWTSSYSRRAAYLPASAGRPSQVVLYLEHGTTRTFAEDSDGAFRQQPGNDALGVIRRDPQTGELTLVHRVTPEGTSGETYDARGNLREVRALQHHVVQIEWMRPLDDASLLVQVLRDPVVHPHHDGERGTGREVHRVFQRLLVGEQGEGGEARALWRLIAIQDAPSNRPEGNADPLRVHRFEYVTEGAAATLGRLRRAIEPDGTEVTYGYDDHGSLISRCSGGTCSSTSYIPSSRAFVARQDISNGVSIAVDYTDRSGAANPYNLELTWTSDASSERHFRRFLRDPEQRGLLRKYAFDSETSHEAFEYDAAGRVLSYRDETGAVTRYERDPVTSDVVSVTDPTGAVTRYRYDAFRRIDRETDPDGRVVLYGWGRGGFGARPERRTPVDASGLSYSEYDLVREGRGRGVRIGADGSRTEVAYDDAGHLAEIVPLDPTPGMPGGERRLAHRYRYDWRGWLVEQTGANGVTVAYAYDASGRPTSVVVDPAGEARRVTLAYDAAGNLAQVTRGRADGIRASTRIEHAMVGSEGYRPVRVEDATFAVTELRYDLLGRLVERRLRGAQDDGSDRVFRYAWVRNDGGFTRRSIGPDGRVYRTQTWNDRGDLTREEDASGVATDYHYDAARRLVRVVGPYDRERGSVVPTVREYAYTAAGYLASATVRSGRALGGEPDADVAEPAPQQTFVRWDQLGRIASIREPGGRTTEFTYDVPNRTVARSMGIQGPVAERRFDVSTYDVLGRLVRTERRLGVGPAPGLVTQYRYEPADDGRDHPTNFLDVHAIVDPTGVVRRFRYDARGDLVRAEEDASRPGEAFVARVHDELGRVVREETALGARTFAYDARDRLTMLTEFTAPSGGAARSQRFVFGADTLREKVAFDGSTTRYAYDAYGRVAGIDLPSTPGAVADGTLDVRFAYHPNGLLASMRDTDGETTYEYDGANRVRSRTRAGATVTYAYDDLGRLARMRYPGASPDDLSESDVRFGYDLSGDVESVGMRSRPSSNEPGVSATWQARNDATGALAEVERIVSDATTSPSVARSIYGYDEGGRTTRIEHRGVNDVGARRPSLWQREFRARDGNGRALRTDTTVVDRARSDEFGFDALGRLSRVRESVVGLATAESAFQYDADGNLTTLPDGRSARADGWGRLTVSTGPALEYDGRGNLTFDGTTRFTYDVNDRLVRSERPGLVVTYGYDGFGNMTWSALGGVRTDYVIDERREHPTVLAARTAGGSTRYVWGPAGLVAKSTVDRLGRPAQARPRAVFMTAALPSSAARDPFDDRVHALIAESGLDVDEITPETPELEARIASAHVVVVSRGVAGALGATRAEALFRRRAVPIVLMEAWIGNALAMTGSRVGIDFDVTMPMAIEVTNGAHPLAGGLRAGTRFVVARGRYSVPGPGATVVATVQGRRDRPTAYGYETGATLFDGTRAAARRIFVSRPENSAELEALFRAALLWARASLPALADRSFAWALTDELGSVVGELDATGQMSVATRYDAWGQPTAATSELPAEVNGPMFHGEWRNDDGTVYLRARHYHPRLGRFLQRDTFAGVPTRPSSLNRYSFVENDPLHNIDPSGHAAESIRRPSAREALDAIELAGAGLSVAGVPAAGEISDGVALVRSLRCRKWTAASIAGASLLLSAVTLSLAPNFGAAARAGSRAAGAARGGGQAADAARAAARAGDLAPHVGPRIENAADVGQRFRNQLGVDLDPQFAGHDAFAHSRWPNEPNFDWQPPDIFDVSMDRISRGASDPGEIVDWVLDQPNFVDPFAAPRIGDVLSRRQVEEVVGEAMMAARVQGRVNNMTPQAFAEAYARSRDIMDTYGSQFPPLPPLRVQRIPGSYPTPSW